MSDKDPSPAPKEETMRENKGFSSEENTNDTVQEKKPEKEPESEDNRYSKTYIFITIANR